MNKLRRYLPYVVGVIMLLIGMLTFGPAVSAQTQEQGSVGVQGEVGAPPPTTGATITTPSNGQVFTNIPVTVSGLCPGDVLVKIFKNGVFAGSAPCVNGSYSLQIDLFSGQNDLVAKVVDALDQAGPDSNTVSVTFNDATFAGAGQRVTLTSNYAKRGANPGDTLSWPVILTGGTGPYAISVDWGDGKPADLFSRQFAGNIDLAHVYDRPGSYTIIVKATDANGDAAFLQLVGIANGAIVDQQDGSTADKIIQACRAIPWWLLLLLLLAMGIISFWLGGRYALAKLQKKTQRNQ